MQRRVCIAVVGLGLLSGCKSSPVSQAVTPAAEPSPGVPPATPLDPATLGSLAGIVKLAGHAPAPVKIDTTMDPACGFGGGGDTFSEQYAVKDGKLANVYIYVKSGPPAAMKMGISGAAPVVLDQKGCVYTPHVIAVQMGGSVEFRNQDPAMHNIHTMPATAGNLAIDISQGPRGTPQRKQFRRPETMMPVRCNNHPWMNAFINVAPTPFFSITGADGAFEIKGLPAGDYTIGAVHEKLGEQEMHLTVKPQAAAKADFTFAMK